VMIVEGYILVKPRKVATFDLEMQFHFFTTIPSTY